MYVMAALEGILQRHSPNSESDGRPAVCLPALPARKLQGIKKADMQRLLESGQVEINYTKLQQLCGLQGKRSQSVDHRQFMNEYVDIFQPRPLTNTSRPVTRVSQAPRGRSQTTHSWSVEWAKRDSLSGRGTARRGRHSLSEGGATAPSRLENIIKLCQTHPPMRSTGHVKRLASLLAHYPDLLPHCSPAESEAIAGRAFVEVFRDKQSCALPGEGGVYLLLRGAVLKLSMSSGVVTSDTISPGQHFGSLSEPAQPLKHKYPLYWTKGHCQLLRVTSSDYKKAVESCQEAQFRDKLELVNSSLILRALPPATKQCLATSVVWLTVPTGTRLLSEGNQFKMISVILKGQCSVHKRALPRGQVRIGVISEGECVGELALEGNDVAPYSVVAMTTLHLGQIPVTELSASEVSQNLPPKIASSYSIPLPTMEQLRHLQADTLMAKQWQALKRSIIKEAGYEH